MPLRAAARILSGLLSCVGAALAQGAPDDSLEWRCWQRYTAERTAVDLREPVAVSFTNLRNGYVLRSPFWVEFGIRGMGVIPADNAHERAGHHHILVNKPLPLNHRAKIPFDDLHRHFGKGQTGALLDLPPGRHTLRLLFADHEHRPHFVYSPEITVQIAGKRVGAGPRIDARDFEATCAAWYQETVTAPRGSVPQVYAKNLRDGEQVASPLRLSLGVTGFGVAPAGRAVKDTGHFLVSATQAGRPVLRLAWADGRTESVIDLPRGDVDLQFTLLSADGKPLVQGAPLRVAVR